MKSLSTVVLTTLILAAPSVFAGGEGGRGSSTSRDPRNPSQQKFEKTVDKYSGWGFTDSNARKAAQSEVTRGSFSGSFDRNGNRVGGSPGRETGSARK